MVRTLAGVAAGIAVGIVVMMVAEGLGNALFPPPALDLNNPEAASALPLPNQLFPILGWIIATLAGGWIAIQISARDWSAWLVAASVVVGALLEFALGRHTLWVMALGILGPPLGAWFAQRLPRWSARPTA